MQSRQHSTPHSLAGCPAYSMQRCLVQKSYALLLSSSFRRRQAQCHRAAAAQHAQWRRGACAVVASADMAEEDGKRTAPPPGQPLLSVAPMMDWTDVHQRQLARLISRHTWVYTEMVVDQTLLHNPQTDRFLWFPPEQRPIVCQLGGSNPETLARAAAIVEGYGYDEINLNCGCPSDRVAGAGCFGAAMMLRPEVVAQCCQAMAQAVSIPITVKCRLGVDDIDSYDALHTFVRVVSEGSPVRHFVIHARKCLLSGLSPHQNRTVPPLRYEWVWALKRDFPHLDFTLNGGVQDLAEVAAALVKPGSSSSAVSTGSESGGGDASSAGPAAAVAAAAGGSLAGVMVGRAVWDRPWDVLGDADRSVFGAPANAAASRREVLEAYARYADGMLGRWRTYEDGGLSPNVRTLMKPLLNFFHGEPRARKWRALVDAAMKDSGSVAEVLKRTLPILAPESLDSPPKVFGQAQQLAHLAAEMPPTPPAQQQHNSAAQLADPQAALAS